MDLNVADILVEALPYIQKFYGMTIVIKYGGHAMIDEKLKENFARDITLMKFVGMNPVIVHGGGPQINSVLKKMGIKSNFIKGMRITDETTMDVVEMVLGGQINKSIVAQINMYGGKAVGLSGKDAKLICAKKMKIIHQENEDTPPEIIDAGLVGEVTCVNSEIIKTLSCQGFIPVIAPIGTGENGGTFNINADLVASKIASELCAARLILLTDVDGVKNSDGVLIQSINANTIKQLIYNKTIVGGMIPKIECAVEALTSGVKKVHIINGSNLHALLLELFTDKGIGTEVML